MIHSRIILQSALRQTTTQARAWRQPVRSVSTAAPPNTSRQPWRWTRRLIYAGIFGTLGVGAGSWADDHFVGTPPPPGSLDDELQLARLQRLFNIGLPIVEELRNNPDYVEKDVYEHFSDEHKSHRLTSGPLAGSGGLGLQVSSPFSFWSPRHVRRTNANAEYSNCRTSGSRFCLTGIGFDRKFSGTKRRSGMLAWSIWDAALRAGRLWSTAAHWVLSSMRIWEESLFGTSQSEPGSLPISTSTTGPRSSRIDSIACIRL
jgi:hypothetical protein